MDTNDLALELSQMHIDKARLLTQVGNALSVYGEAGVLLWLNRRECDTFSIDIIDHFGLTPGRVANIIKGLDRRGFIIRDSDPDDQRKVKIRLTDTGRKQADNLFKQMNDGHVRMLEILGQEDAAAWICLLKKIIQYVEEGTELHSLEFS